MKKQHAVILCIFAIFLAASAYYTGLNGDFLFDDFPNLKYLGEYGTVNNWLALKSYILSGWSGPTGRPISLLSFLIDDNTWPSVAAPFKYTSLCFHLICSLLLAWVVYLLLLSAAWVEQRAIAVAVLAASFWLLHPYWVSTTLYVVQRMTILSGLFMLAGMVGYLKGRLWLQQPQQHRTGAAYALMTASAGLGTLLAVLSKENGAILPMLLLVIEVFLRRITPNTRPNKIWLALILGLPSFAILAYLGKNINFSPDLWPSRPFNQVERLYSESRIMWDYIGQLWLPRIEGAGLYQDGFQISRSLLEPISTMWAVLAWAFVLLILPLLYRHFPFVWLAIVFFLCGHLIESTVIGLELHFEHRNYSPAFFMFLPLAVGINWLGERYRSRIAITIALLMMLLLAGMTWQRSQLWADADKLQTYWAMKDPQSARGQNHLISGLVAEKKYTEALALANESIQALPHSSLITMSWLRIHVNTRQATEQHFQQAAEQLIQQPFDAQTVAGLRTLVDDAVASPELTLYQQPLLHLLDTLSERGPYRNFPLFLRIQAYNKARLYILMGDTFQAQKYYIEAIDRYGQASAAMQIFSEIAEAGHLHSALQVLEHIQQGVENSKLQTDPLGQAYYQQEIQRIRAALIADISTQ